MKIYLTHNITLCSVRWSTETRLVSPTSASQAWRHATSWRRQNDVRSWLGREQEASRGPAERGRLLVYTRPARHGAAAGRYQRPSHDQLGHVRRTTAALHDVQVQVGLRRAPAWRHRNSLLPASSVGRNSAFLSALWLDNSHSAVASVSTRKWTQRC